MCKKCVEKKQGKYHEQGKYHDGLQRTQSAAEKHKSKKEKKKGGEDDLKRKINH